MKKSKRNTVEIAEDQETEFDLVDYFAISIGLRLGCNSNIYDHSNVVQNNKPNIFKYGGYRD